MADLGTMVRRIRTDINRGPAHDFRIKEAVGDAIKLFRSKRLGFNLKRSQTVLASGVEFLSLPTDWIEADHLRLEQGNEREPLTEVSYDWVEDRQRGTPTTGEPYRFAIQARELRLYPIPDRSYTLVLAFHCDLTAVSASASDGATNAWMDEGEELIRCWAMGDLYVNYIGGGEITRGLALKAYARDEVLPTLEKRAAREQSSGRIRPFL